MLPIAELHLHLEGTLEPELILAIAERNRVELPYEDLDALKARYASHTQRGIPLIEVMEGVADPLSESLRTHGMSSGLIVAFLRDESEESAMATLDAVLALGVPFIGVGLDSAEMGNPPSKFARVFERARAEGLERVAHAGEEGPPSNVWEALDQLDVHRIDHGIRCLEDHHLVRRLVQDQIPLTVCPLSNVSLKVVDDIASHPLKTMLDLGLKVTVNSDDPAYFGGYIDDNFDALIEAGHLTPEDLATLARNSIEASFADPERKRQLIEELNGAA